jgi:hypothetical protein
MINILLFTAFIITSLVFSLIWTVLFIAAMNRRGGICCHHKPEHVHSPDRLVHYLECKKCGDRSFEVSSSIANLEDNDININTGWLCGHERVL